MTDDRKNIDRLFSENLGGYREKPPVNAWQRLDDELSGADRKKMIFFFRLAAASVVILLAFAAGYFYAVNFSEKSGLAQRDATEQTTPADQFRSTSVTKADQDITNKDQNSDIELKAIQENELRERGKINSEEKVLLASSDQKNKIIPESDESIQSGNERIHGVMSLPKLGSVLLSKNNFVAKPAYDAFAENQSHYSTINVLPEDHADQPVDLKEEVYVYNGLPDNSQKLKWTIGAQVAPTVSFRDISTNYSNNPTQSVQDKSHLDQSEESLLAYSGGLQVNLAVNKKWGFQSGVYFSRIGQVNSDALQFRQDSKGYILYAINTSAGEVDIAFDKVPASIRNVDSPKDTIGSNYIGNVKVIQNFDLFEIPFLVNYHILSKKLSLKLAGGISPAYLIDNKTYMEFDNNSYDIGNASNLNNIIVNSTIGLGFGYEFVKKLTLSFEPTFKYSLNPINKSSEFDYHPYYMSWFTGLKYTF